MMGHFIVKSKINLDEVKLGEIIQESDYATLTEQGNFVQLEYKSDKEKDSQIEVKPGIWSIERTPYGGLDLKKTSFSSYELLSDFIHTKNITDKIDCFLRNLHKYKEFGIEVPSRKMLLYGVPGTGKSASISVVCNKYVKDGKTAVIVWHTDKFEDYEIRDFFKVLKYTDVEKLILTVEDIGGTSREDGPKYAASSLLSLLDNQEMIFKIPTIVLATTNFPELLLGSIANRPQRFDDKIEVGHPSPEARVSLLKFFLKTELDEDVEKYVKSKACDQITPSHLRESVIRSTIYEMTLKDTLKQLVEEIELYNNAFSKKSKLGIV